MTDFPLDEDESRLFGPDYRAGHRIHRHPDLEDGSAVFNIEHGGFKVEFTGIRSETGQFELYGPEEYHGTLLEIELPDGLVEMLEQLAERDGMEPSAGHGAPA